VEGHEQTTPLDRAQLRDVTLNDAELMREILAALVDDTTRQLKLLSAAIQEQDATRCMHLAHYSKGACANLGANAAAALFKEIEQRAASHDFGQCTECLARLGGAVDALRSEVQTL
jgi:HPt (histidine-containing phosphotransfer) domain-containing protein